jgi:hypothetical protein
MNTSRLNILIAAILYLGLAINWKMTCAQEMGPVAGPNRGRYQSRASKPHSVLCRESVS